MATNNKYSVRAVSDPMFSHSEVIGIRSNWVIRNDHDYMLLYKVAIDESKHWILPPLHAYIVSLFDGLTTYGEIVREVAEVFGITSHDEAEFTLSHYIAYFNHDEPLIISDRGANIGSFQTDQYYIPFEKYHVPCDSRLSLPTKVSFFVSPRCQTDCVYCYADRRHHSSQLSYQDFANLVEECLDKKILNLDVIGGDCLADPIAIRLMLLMIEKGLPTFISTKAQLSPSLVYDLVDRGFLEPTVYGTQELQLSVDSARPEVADYLTGTRDYLDRVDHNIKICRDFGIIPRIKAVLTSLNCDEFNEFIQRFEREGIVKFQFVQYGISHFKYRPDLYLSAKQKEALRTKASELSARYPHLEIAVQDDILTEELSLSERTRAWQTRAICTGGYTGMVVIPDGHIVGCEQIPHEQKFILGDVADGGIEAAWKDCRFDSFLFPDKVRFDGTVCEDCRDFDVCRRRAKVCYRDTLNSYGTVYEAPPDCPYQEKKGRRLL